MTYAMRFIPATTRRGGKVRPTAVGVLGFGGSSIGNLARPVPEGEALAAIARGYELGIRYFDTAPLYGAGLGEHRMGHVLRNYPRSELVISTKVGRLLKPLAADQRPEGPDLDRLPFEIVYDYGYDGVMRSVEASLQRIGTDRVDLAFIHDIDPYNHGAGSGDRFREAMDGAFPALARLREEGVLQAIGVGINNTQLCEDCARAADFDVFLLAGRYTLLEHGPLESFLPLCVERGIAVILGAPFNSGVLARGSSGSGTYNYLDVPPDVKARVVAIEAACRDFGISLRAAALQFPLAHPAVVSVLPGIRSVAQAEQCAAAMDERIPAAFWQRLKDDGLIPRDTPIVASPQGHRA